MLLQWLWIFLMLVRDIYIVEKLLCKLRMIAPSVATKGDYMLTQFWRGKRLQWEAKSVADCLRPTQTRHWDEYCSFSMRNDPTWLLIFSTLSSNIGLFFPHTPQWKVWNVLHYFYYYWLIDWLSFLSIHITKCNRCIFSHGSSPDCSSLPPPLFFPAVWDCLPALGVCQLYPTHPQVL